jgi:NADH dehydrogenase
MSEVAPGLITVFGGSGFVGGQVVRILARHGWRIRVAVRRPDRAYKLQPSGHVGQIQAVHVGAARTIADACAAAGVGRLVHVSALGANPESASNYACTKAAGEMAVREAKPDAVVIRPSIVFGSGDSFLNKFAAMASIAPALPLIGGGQTRFQPVYVGDAAEAIVRAVERPDATGRTFELGGPEVMTFEDILKLILRETRRRNGLVPLPFFAARAIGSLAQLTGVVGVTPVLTRDQVALLESDNVVSDSAEGLAELGIQPTGIEAIAPAYLWRYRRGGQFSERPTDTAATVQA